MSDKIASKIVSAGRSKKWVNGVVNPSVQRASTVVFENVAELKKSAAKRHDKTLFYGRRGTQTSFSFQEAMSEIDGGAGCAIYPCGTAAIAGALLSFLKSGDHLLMVDNVYEPTRDLCDNLLANFGIKTTYYDPMLGGDIEPLVQDNTKVIFTESPGSLSMEVQDIPAISKVCKRHDIVLMLDNTYASILNFDAFEHGVDISIQSATKYIVGHSDVMLGTASSNEKHWPQLRENSYLLGQCASPDDIYLALRGLRTVGVRMAQQAINARLIANWLDKQAIVDHIRHPQFDSCPGHEIFKRDHKDANGLFSFVIKEGSAKKLAAFIDHMTHFKIGYSWGGYESLIIGVENLQSLRTVTSWPAGHILIRLHIGLEDPQDLIDDLELGLQRFIEG
ncbi:cystathionine beta-lyase [Alginatibacterium sediminis]|uniref:Cystathionine beta-lyase n=1 Tax=Alginatibacterium sediminis TaxID=2164068 RepID=A0A420EGN3_9ALTE|nr:cystathionine beta-lyase [Alginatibacterium sediminis]RKF19824.1 cystathionine beta-lyase [Alginatibacterium sediminis]